MASARRDAASLFDAPIQPDSPTPEGHNVRLALYQPDIPQNLGAAIRLAACFAMPLDVIEPCGFPLTDKAAKRAALDYGAYAHILRHDSLATFQSMPERNDGRLVLIETDGL